MLATASLPDHNPAARLRLLFVKLKHIGDALLLTPTLVAVKAAYPNAEIWVVVREGTEGILAGCPAIHRMVTVTPVETDRRPLGSWWRDARTWLALRQQGFDYAFELTDGDRGRWLAGMSGARLRCVNTSHYPLTAWWQRWFNRPSATPWTQGHRVEKDYSLAADFLPLASEIPPLCFDRARATEPDFLRGVDDFVVFHPGTRWVKKRWPKDHWLELGHRMLARTSKVVVSCGPDADERALGAELVAAWGAEHATSTDGQLNWAELAGCLYRARAFVGVDTAAMHLAAACQCPLVAIWGYSVVSQWRPWRAPHELINLSEGRNRDEWPAEEIMRVQTPELVFAAAERMLLPASGSAR